MSREADLRVLDSILDAIATGRFPALAEAESEFRALRRQIDDGAEGAETLAAAFRSNPDRMDEAIVAIVEETLDYVKKQINHFKKLKKERPLTTEEKRFGSETLFGLLGSLRHLISARNR